MLTILVALLLVVQYRLWVGDTGLAGVWRLEQAIDAQHQENARLKARNQQLSAEVYDLKHGLDAVEERARRELGMVREDETFYQFLDR